MRLRIADRLDQLLDDMRRRRHVGIAHAEIDDVLAFRARLRLELVHALENVRRQTLYAVELFAHGQILIRRIARRRPSRAGARRFRASYTAKAGAGPRENGPKTRNQTRNQTLYMACPLWRF